MEYETPLFFRVMEYAAGVDHDVVDMVSGNPDWGPPAALREGLRSYAEFEPEEFQYAPSEGLADLREEIADRRGVDVDRVVVTNGTGEANYLALAVALERDAGDTVVCVDPVYPYYPSKIRLLGGTVRTVPAGPTGTLDPETVRSIVDDETAAILVNTPNNPTGAVYDHETMAALATVAEDADALLISDEVYDHFDPTGTFASALSLESDRCVVTTGFSKSLAITGLRVGYVVLPPPFVQQARTRHMLVNVSGPRPSQYAVWRALRETPPSYYERQRDRLANRVATFSSALESVAEVTSPDGGFYVLTRFDGYPGTLENVLQLIDDAGVAGMPGVTFGETCADWIRFALLTPRVEEAATRLVERFE